MTITHKKVELPLVALEPEGVEFVDVFIRKVGKHSMLVLADGRVLRGQLPTDHFFYFGDESKGEERQGTFRPSFLLEAMADDIPK